MNLLTNYQTLALETAEPEAFDHTYLVNGIVGEVGEMFGQRGKAHWHRWSAEKLQDALILELGDVAWMTAILLHTCEVRSLETGGPRKSEDPWYDLLDTSQWIYENWKSGEPLLPPARALWKTLSWSAFDLTTITMKEPEIGGHSVYPGKPLSVALERNVEKLRSRAERNVLKGAGDYR